MDANRLRAGYVLARNPNDHYAVTKYRLSPDDVDRQTALFVLIN